MPVTRQMKELLLQSLEHERGGELVYDAALECVLNEELEEEWEDYLEETERHVEVLTEACEALGVDPDEMTPARQIAQHSGNALVVAMKMALEAGDPEAAELIACECVMLAETRNRFNWDLIGECAKALTGDERGVLMDAYEEVEYDEEEHLYQTRAWCRQLWLSALGVAAALPPSEEAGEPDEAEPRARVEDRQEGLLK